MCTTHTYHIHFTQHKLYTTYTHLGVGTVWQTLASTRPGHQSHEKTTRSVCVETHIHISLTSSGFLLVGVEQSPGIYTVSTLCAFLPLPWSDTVDCPWLLPATSQHWQCLLEPSQGYGSEAHSVRVLFEWQIDLVPQGMVVLLYLHLKCSLCKMCSQLCLVEEGHQSSRQNSLKFAFLPERSPSAKWTQRLQFNPTESLFVWI